MTLHEISGGFATMIDQRTRQGVVAEDFLTMQQAQSLFCDMGLTVTLRTMESWIDEGVLVALQPAPGKQKRIARSEVVRVVNRRAGE